MIDDERRVLREIEDHLRMADPAFVARMTVPAGHPFPTLSVLGVLLFLTAPLIGLLFGTAAVGRTAAVACYLAVVVLAHRRRRARRR